MSTAREVRIEDLLPLLSPTTRAKGYRRRGTLKIVTATNGYQTVFDPNHPLAMKNGYVYVHRLLAHAQGKTPEADEEVHHTDEDRSNNDPGNLEVLPVPQHHVLHRKAGCNRRLPGEQNEVISCACGCGERFEKFDRWSRPRSYLSGHNTARRGNENGKINQDRLV